MSNLKVNSLDAPQLFVQASDEERMRSLLEQLTGYMEFYHGGSLDLVSFDGETLKIRLKGACVGCHLSPVTVHGWIEGTVKPFFPKLKKVESV